MHLIWETLEKKNDVDSSLDHSTEETPKETSDSKENSNSESTKNKSKSKSKDSESDDEDEDEMIMMLCCNQNEYMVF